MNFLGRQLLNVPTLRHDRWHAMRTWAALILALAAGLAGCTKESQSALRCLSVARAAYSSELADLVNSPRSTSLSEGRMCAAAPGESPRWIRLALAHRDVNQAIRSFDVPGAQSAARRLVELTESRSDHACWREMVSATQEWEVYESMGYLSGNTCQPWMVWRLALLGHLMLLAAGLTLAFGWHLATTDGRFLRGPGRGLEGPPEPWNAVHAFEGKTDPTFTRALRRHLLFTVVATVATFGVVVGTAIALSGHWQQQPPELVLAYLTCIAGLLLSVLVKPRRRGLTLFLRGYSGETTDSNLQKQLEQRLGAYTRVLALFHHKTLPYLPLKAQLAAALALFAPSIALIQNATGPQTGSFLPGLLFIWYALARALSRYFVTPVTGSWSLEAVCDRLASLNRSRLAWLTDRIEFSNLMLKTSNHCWQLTVMRLAAQADCILLDLSEPRPGLVWELAYCRQHHAEKLVCFSKVLHGAALGMAPSGATSNPHVQRCAEILGGVPVLVPPPTMSGLSSFFAELSHAAFRTIAGRHPPSC